MRNFHSTFSSRLFPILALFFTAIACSTVDHVPEARCRYSGFSSVNTNSGSGIRSTISRSLKINYNSDEALAGFTTTYDRLLEDTVNVSVNTDDRSRNDYTYRYDNDGFLIESTFKLHRDWTTGGTGSIYWENKSVKHLLIDRLETTSYTYENGKLKNKVRKVNDVQKGDNYDPVTYSTTYSDDYTYEANGIPAGIKGKDSDGNSYTTIYQNGLKVSYTFSSQRNTSTTTYTYSNGRLIREAGPALQVDYEYDSRGNTTKQVFTSGGIETTYENQFDDKTNPESLFKQNFKGIPDFFWTFQETTNVNNILVSRIITDSFLRENKTTYQYNPGSYPLSSIESNSVGGLNMSTRTTYNYENCR